MKYIIMKKALMMRAMNLLMLIWKAVLSRDAAIQSVRHLKTELESLLCVIRGEQRPPM